MLRPKGNLSFQLRWQSLPCRTVGRGRPSGAGGVSPLMSRKPYFYCHYKTIEFKNNASISHGSRPSTRKEERDERNPGAFYGIHSSTNNLQSATLCEPSECRMKNAEAEWIGLFGRGAFEGVLSAGGANECTTGT